MTDLVLFSTFEEISSQLESGDLNNKLMQFIEPLPDVEQQISLLAKSSGTAGKLAFILGEPGSGKSTFLKSISWKKHIGLRDVIDLNANDYTIDGLRGLLLEIKKYETEARTKRDRGPTCLIINYLETIDDFEDKDVRGFFRQLNAVLRNSPMLILWPVTRQEDVDLMQSYSYEISRSIFVRGNEVVNFSGPSFEKFKDITSRTISVLNDGKELAEFGLTYDTLAELQENLLKRPRIERTMREYIEMVRDKWKTESGYQDKLRKNIPKSTEVWFVFSYPLAESVVSGFSRRTDRLEDNWSVIHDKIYEYIRDNQRSAQWDASRLQLALYGSIKTRIMYLPTNTLVSCAYSYSSSSELIEIIEREGVPIGWKNKSKAKRTLEKSPMYGQIIGEVIAAGKRRGGPAAVALEQSAPAFEKIAKWVGSSTGGSDKVINKSIAEAMSDLGPYEYESDRKHPWLKNIIPDIFVDMPHKQVCIEFHHTNRSEPHVVADYVLKKLNVYMNEITRVIKDK
ncbi:ATP-binding protein [Marinobacterium weihaiense]|uniref:ATP-binding protein n=1 Tax=Marinobacterium weihaiense TaxID=2851016 RepID=A0ABS6MC74_9GAMM|nr:ATP-binding protein [Marinobacterium weihaiense]MBV0933894.1 ATP-binding protein [Marinobacterium weihaiense]